MYGETITMGKRNDIILVIEDDVQIKHLLCSILKQNGYETVSAFQGRKVFNWL